MRRSSRASLPTAGGAGRAGPDWEPRPVRADLLRNHPRGIPGEAKGGASDPRGGPEQVSGDIADGGALDVGERTGDMGEEDEGAERRLADLDALAAIERVNDLMLPAGQHRAGAAPSVLPGIRQLVSIQSMRSVGLMLMMVIRQVREKRFGTPSS
jgi:hypothetical protein